MTNAEFEALAAEFHLETGMLAPGKDYAALGPPEPDWDLRRNAWAKFRSVRREAEKLAQKIWDDAPPDIATSEEWMAHVVPALTEFLNKKEREKKGKITVAIPLKNC